MLLLWWLLLWIVRVTSAKVKLWKYGRVGLPKYVNPTNTGIGRIRYIYIYSFRRLSLWSYLYLRSHIIQSLSFLNIILWWIGFLEIRYLYGGVTTLTLGVLSLLHYPCYISMLSEIYFILTRLNVVNRVILLNQHCL